MTSVFGADQLRERVGAELGVSAWFAPGPDVAVDDLYVLSLGPKFTNELLTVSGFAFGLNYGYDAVRFARPVEPGVRVRMRLGLAAVDDVPGGIQVTMRQTFEAESDEEPVCVADSVARWVS